MGVCAARTDQKLQEVVDRIFPEFKEQEVILEKEFYANNNFKLKEEVTAKNDVEVGADGAAELLSSPTAPLNSASRGRAKGTTPTKKSHNAKLTNNASNITCNRPFTIEVYPQQTYVSL
ncbi:unnamed protein product [Phytophthora lilii]|uniref:Unnamed protein product n=1 Tax=Phytophthora lilii TaxID=2077276 RepID=A0A9W6YIT5_9STRA|nr:unnamed protein product [Phytophthora lilii]